MSLDVCSVLLNVCSRDTHLEVPAIVRSLLVHYHTAGLLSLALVSDGMCSLRQGGCGRTAQARAARRPDLPERGALPHGAHTWEVQGLLSVVLNTRCSRVECVCSQRLASSSNGALHV